VLRNWLKKRLLVQINKHALVISLKRKNLLYAGFFMFIISMCCLTKKHILCGSNVRKAVVEALRF
ncbi:hypothetical protein, partial [Alteromonas sp. BZK5]|uniref:hypothetical protein n=1 Tax=Alteromonas sp. BZK5 TaxID=1904459 RepID=UPI001CA421E2